MLIRTAVALFLSTSILLAATPSEAHFIWVRLVPSENSQWTAIAYFAETPHPDRDDLLDKIGNARFQVRRANGAPQPLALRKSGDAEHAMLTAPVGPQRPCSLEATCDYGTYQLGDRQVLLQYYARAVDAQSVADMDKLGPATALALDMVPSLEAGKLRTVVLWQGKPLPAVEVQVCGPDKKRRKLVSDELGAIAVSADQGGEFALLASHTEKDKTGEHKGKKYAAVGHYATLTIALPKSETADAKQPKNDKAAADMLARARNARAVWDNFPGFTADATVQIEHRSAKGKIKVGSEGQLELKLNGLSAEDLKWVKQHLGSITQHRMPDGSLGDGATLVQEEGSHPLGQRIRLAEEVMGSEYRIKDDVVRQVNRLMGKQRLVINVLEVTRNEEGKYLPSVFNVAMWDVASGNLGANQTVTHHWLRVGKFDLPQHIQEVDCRQGGNQVRSIELSAHRLSQKPGEAEQAYQR